MHNKMHNINIKDALDNIIKNLYIGDNNDNNLDKAYILVNYVLTSTKEDLIQFIEYFSSSLT